MVELFSEQFPEASEERSLLQQLDPQRLPEHIAVIMDGNGRWAEARGFNRIEGHRRGTESARVVTECAVQLGIRFLTLYMFSTENWGRPKGEVRFLFNIFYEKLISEKKLLDDNGIRLAILGDLDPLPVRLQKKLQTVIADSAENNRMQLNLALNYGARLELVRAMRLMIEKGTRSSDVTPELISAHLYTAGIPDPDLMIRTSGETRISNFLLYQLAYSELIFTPVLWPDFGIKDFLAAILEFQHRQRRYGLI